MVMLLCVSKFANAIYFVVDGTWYIVNQNMMVIRTMMDYIVIEKKDGCRLEYKHVWRRKEDREYRISYSLKTGKRDILFFK